MEQTTDNYHDMDLSEKYVIKRNGTHQPLDLVKIKTRLLNKAYNLNEKFINFDVLVGKIVSGIFQGIPSFVLTHFRIGVTTAELDNLVAETCAYMTIVHPDYSKLAARVAISNL
jgi:ribonucleoside-diphosphate reductase subunit M1